MKPSRLYQQLDPTAELFEFTVGGARLHGDASLHAVTITRGKSSPGGGVHPSTCEVSTAAFASVRTAQSCAVQLSDYGAGHVAALAGTTADQIKARFSGRIGRQVVEDTGKRQRTTFLAASWSAQLRRDQTVYAPAAGQPVGDVIQALMTPPKLALPVPVTMATPAQYGTVWKVPAPGTFSDLIGDYTTALGVLVRDTRAGGSQVLTHRFRQDRAIAALPDAAPLTRSHAISPATWEQANDQQPRNYRLSYTNSGNTTTTAIYGDPADTTAEIVEVDMTHIRFSDTTQPTMEAYARRARDWVSSYTIPSVTVDLLHLINSPKPVHRLQAARLLALEAGDPVYFSGDWYTQLRGIQYAEQIVESIGPDGWTLELSLIPSHAAVGEVSPVVPARTWESATGTWNDETRTWNES